jgi:hypothetical protein
VSAPSPAARFAALCAERRHAGVRRHGRSYLSGPTLLEALALEAIDATNYAVMELERVREHYPEARDEHAAVTALAHACATFAHTAAEALEADGGPRLDIAAVAHERTHGDEAYRGAFDAFLYRDNLAELAEELADAHVLAGFERDRRAHRAIAGPLAGAEVTRLGEIASALGAFADDVARDVHAAAPVRPPAASAAAAIADAA